MGEDPPVHGGREDERIDGRIRRQVERRRVSGESEVGLSVNFERTRRAHALGDDRPEDEDWKSPKHFVRSVPPNGREPDAQSEESKFLNGRDCFEHVFEFTNGYR